MSEIGGIRDRRLWRLERICGFSEVVGVPFHPDRPLVALTSSRLGNDPRQHFRVCRYLRRSMADCREIQGELLVARGSAIEPWVDRAAELFDFPCRKLAVSSLTRPTNLNGLKKDLQRVTADAAVIALADRVDALYVRPGGRIEQLVKDRLGWTRNADVRVAVASDRKCAAARLIRAGAIGWLEMRDRPQKTSPSDSLKTHQKATLGEHPSDQWAHRQDDWLIHCTRGCHGPWPDETTRQYRDSMLMGLVSAQRRGPLDTLLRIVRSGRLIAAATASRHRYPVVCFSAAPLQQLMDQRRFRPHLRRWDFEPYGVAIRLAEAKRLGVQAVIYGNPGDDAGISEPQRFRFHPNGKKHNWQSEREWRSCQTIDLHDVHTEDVRVFALDNARSRRALRNCIWQVSFLSTIDRKPGSV